MNKKLLLLSAFLAGASWTVLAQDLVLSEGQYYTDETQTTPYTGRYTEFYEDGMLKMELYLKDGRPEGTYVIYYPDRLCPGRRQQREGGWQDRRGAFLLSRDLPW